LPRKTFFVVGLYTLGYGIYDMGYFAVMHNIREPNNLRERYGKDTWVVVSGATNETGEVFCQRLGKMGFNLALVDEDSEKLEQLKEKVRNDTNAEAKAFKFDFRKKCAWEDYQELCELIQKETGDISILVNNAEAFDHGKLHKMDDEEVLDVLAINGLPMTFLMRFLGPTMKERKNAKSAIVNMTSYYSQFQIYNAPIYTSAKGYQDVLSQIVGYENQDMDILTVQNLPAKSKRHPNGVDPTETVEGVLHDLGHERISYGHWKHSLFRYYYLFMNCQFFNGPRGFGTGHFKKTW